MSNKHAILSSTSTDAILYVNSIKLLKWYIIMPHSPHQQKYSILDLKFQRPNISSWILANQYVFKISWIFPTMIDGLYSNHDMFIATCVFSNTESTSKSKFLITVTFILLVEAITTFVLMSTTYLTTFSPLRRILAPVWERKIGCWGKIM